MGLAELFLIAVGLSMDAFAVSIGKGLGMRRLDVRQAALIAVFFGGFQALMPAIGWVLGAQFAHYATSFAPWIAFALLAFIGAKMLIEAIRESADDAEIAEAGQTQVVSIGELFALAVATSIDALAAGVSFSFLDVDIAFAVSLIGATTFVLSFIGVAAGNRLGARWEKPSAIVGGIILIAIGAKILLEGLGIMA